MWDLIVSVPIIAYVFTFHRLKKAPGHGHTTTWYKFWQHFKAFIIPIILYQISFTSLFYMIFCFISFMYTKLQGKRRQSLETIVLMQAGLITLITGCRFQNIRVVFNDFSIKTFVVGTH